MAQSLNHIGIKLLAGLIALPASFLLLKNKTQWFICWGFFFLMQGLVWILKFYFDVARPAGEHGLESPSFPSGGAADAGFLAFYLSILFPKYWLIFQLLGIFGASLRVISGAHFMVDVFAGYLIGSAFAALSYVFWKKTCE